MSKAVKKCSQSLGRNGGYRCYSNEKLVVEQKVLRSLRQCAQQRPIAELRLRERFSDKGFGLHWVSSAITILVLLSAAVVRIGVNCARLFGMSTTFSLE
jgi:hypothetical protein